MDGFTSIPIQNSPISAIPKDASTSPVYSTNPYKDNSISQGDGIEIVDEVKKSKEGSSFGFLLPLSILALLGVFAYFGYLVFLRYITLEKISLLSEDFQALSANVNKSEIEDFIALDNSLRAIGEKLNDHTQLSGVLSFVNKNIRSNVQIIDYKIESREEEVSVGLSSVAPTFRELAEQTEKMTELKTTGAIKDFRVTQMSLEADGRKIRYTLNLTFDKKKISVAALSAETNLNNIEN